MTWVNDKNFTSGFYFTDVRSPSVDVSFEVEGAEDIIIRSLTAHAHPDAICRLFSRGIVLANPSRKPYTFDLEELSPGRSYRRLRGVAMQDPQTNNGQPVANRVTLGERDCAVSGPNGLKISKMRMQRSAAIRRARALA